MAGMHSGVMRLSMAKARKMLRHGSVRGKKITKKQQGYFGLVAGGGRPSRMK
ncbi:MAG: hypothetical protein QME66_08315 [Candidatus Eisenbacteria bacterium]|nr:hypothetical protein [Candidatus Eisenbacteria bacterium]